MSTDGDDTDAEREARMDSAIAASQQQEREEREADLRRQRESDERIVRALADTDDESS